MTALQVSDRGRDRKSFVSIKLQHTQRQKFIFSNPTRPFNKHFLKQNALRGITKTKGFLLTPSMHKSAVFSHRRYQSWLGISDLGNPVTAIAGGQGLGDRGGREPKPRSWEVCVILKSLPLATGKT